MKKALLAPLALFLAFAGCMKVHEDIVVMPDGTGKLLLSISIKMEKDDPGKFTEEEMMSEDPDEMQKTMPGIVALSKPKVEKKDGWAKIAMVAYFDDVNKVKFKENDEAAKIKQEFSFKKEGDGFVFEVTGNMLDDGEDAPPEDAPPEVKKQMEEMFKKMFEGFEFRHSVKMPGTITAVEGFQTKENRDALFKVGEKDFLKPEDQKKVKQVKKFRAVCGKSELSDAEISDFRKELEKAKADWTELRKEMKKNAEKKKAQEK